jgi:hypothetical protein
MGGLWQAALTVLALAGHVAIFVFVFNRVHAMSWRRKLVKTLEKAWIAAALALFFALLVAGATGTLRGHAAFSGGAAASLLRLYAWACWVALALAVPYWLLPKLRERVPAALASNDTRTVDLDERLGGLPVHGALTRLLAGLPGNEIGLLAIQRKTLLIEDLPAELEGLAIAHLSDLHMTGQLGQAFYDAVVDETNALPADLVAITGDILEKPRCLPWVAPTLGRLEARLGKYFVLGNHEQRLPDVAVLRQALVAAGIADLAGRTERRSLGGCELLLAGTELPWFGHAPHLRSDDGAVPLRILFAHTPDQLGWARHQGFHLMLAGHNHGGQIRLPLVGPLIAPSWYGCRYAGGLYWEPPTLLHVSRGLAGIHPVRFNCPPELALLILRRAPNSMPPLTPDS